MALSELQTWIDKLPKQTISLKQIDLNDSVPGSANTCNINFKELSELFNVLAECTKSLADNLDVKALLRQLIEEISSNKLAVPIKFAQRVGDTTRIEHNEMVYEINRLDETTYVVTRAEGIAIWDTSNIIAQLKSTDGVILNTSIVTRDYSVIISFKETPAEDYILLLV